MIVVMKEGATKEDISHVVEKLSEAGVDVHLSRGKFKTLLLVIGDVEQAGSLPLSVCPGVERVVRILKPFKLVSREAHQDDSVVDVGGVPIGGREFIVVGGPCSVESDEQVESAAQGVKKSGGRLLRGGAFKPRTSPYSFQGHGVEGLAMLEKAREATGLPIVTEVMDTRDIPDIAQSADMLQVGARNMQNFVLLKAVGETKMPVLIKRGFANTIEEWLMAAEYVMGAGSRNVVLCERGIRTFETYTRNTLDVSSIPIVKGLSHLPVIVDPSHAAGRADLVEPLALAAMAVGAHGVMIEVHPHPEEAWCDGSQSLTLDAFGSLMDKLRSVAPALGCEIAPKA